MVILFSLVIWLLGMALIRCTKMAESDENILLLSMPTGFAISALVVNILYIRLYMSLDVARIVLVALALISAGYLLRSKTFTKKVFCEYLAIMIFFGIISIPGLIRGEQYYVYRGNVWDQLIYYSEIVYASMYKIGIDLTKLAYTSDAILEGYTQIMTDRPTAPLMCALLCPQGYSTIFKQAFLYHMLMMSTVVCSMTYLIRRIFNKKYLSYIAAIIYVVGFYGQIQYDINAWSQVVAMSGLIAYVCVVMSLVCKDINRECIKISDAVFLVICGSGLFLLYPENMIIHGGLIVVATIVVYIISRKLPSLKMAIIAICVPVLVLLICIVLDMNTIKFALGQINSAYSEVRQSWANYFDAYWLGYHGVYAETEAVYVFKALISIVPCWCGMYILTPNYGLSSLLLIRAWMLAMILLSIGIIIVILRGLTVLIPNAKNRAASTKDSISFKYICIIVLMGIIMFASMFSKKEYWSAGKLLLYVSQYLYVVLIFPVLSLFGERRTAGLGASKSLVEMMKTFLYYVAIVTSVVFVSTQIIFAGMRIYDAITNDNGTGYCGNYPSDQYPRIKETYRFDCNPKQYDKDEVVTINVDEPFYQDYIKVALSYEKIKYCAEPDSQFRYGKLKDE